MPAPQPAGKRMSDVTSLIESLEEQRCQALINGDTQKLAELFSERLNWCHSSGQVDNKRSLLERISSGQTKYKSMSRHEERFVLGSGAAVATGLVQMVAIIGGKEHHLSNRYTTVWLHEDANWRLVVWQ